VKRTLALLVTVLAVLTLAACTSSKPKVVDVTNTTTVTGTRAPSVPAFTPAPAKTVAPLPPGAKPVAGEVDKACPYIPSSQNEGEGSMADLEGDRVYRTTVLTNLKPVGCRFYFWCCEYQAISEIAPRTFSSPDAARAAMIATAKVDPNAQGFPGLVRGVDAISYRTKFLGDDGSSDWACVFVKGKVMVVVRTQRKDTSLNARLIAQAIAPKF
jgi:hypothetical protein